MSRHAVEACLGEQSLKLCEQAGDLAHQLKDDLSAAMIHYRRAQQIARWELLMGEDDPRYLQLSHKLARSLRLAGHNLSAEMVLKEAISAGGAQAQRARLIGEQARLQRTRGELEQAAATLRQGIKLAIPCGHPELLAELYLELSGVLTDLQQDDLAIEELREGVLLATMGGEDALPDSARDLWRLHATLTVLHHRQEDMGAAAEAGALALEHARRERSPHGLAHCHLTVGRLHAEQGSPDAALDHLQQGLALYQELGSRQKVAECLLLMASLTPQQDTAQVTRALTLSEQVGWTEGIEQARRLGAAGAVAAS